MSTDKRDPMDGDYLGLIFGERLTLYAGVFLAVLIGLAVARHYYLDVPFGITDSNAGPVPVDTMVVDTLFE
ncbi:hypothetical protein CEQ90_10455 [Lewinellaceae bacterium SD302]|nr:hypothetical protein CEQ90_10455 [Lewinellaceae bacterium SD302]